MLAQKLAEFQPDLEKTVKYTASRNVSMELPDGHFTQREGVWSRVVTCSGSLELKQNQEQSKAFWLFIQCHSFHSRVCPDSPNRDAQENSPVCSLTQIVFFVTESPEFFNV